MKTVHCFDDGDVVVAATGLNTVVWTRLDGQWYNTAIGAASVTDQQMGENIHRDASEGGAQWHFVGNVFVKTPFEEVDQFVAHFYPKD